jgi:hypothetical protein
MATCEVCGTPTSRKFTRCRRCAQRQRRAEAGIELDEAMLRMHSQQGKSLRQIGAAVGLSHERVRVRIARAVERIPDDLEKRRLHGDQ